MDGEVNKLAALRDEIRAEAKDMAADGEDASVMRGWANTIAAHLRALATPPAAVPDEAMEFVRMVGEEFGNAAGARLRALFAAMAGGLNDAQCEAVYQAVSMSNFTRDVKSPERKRQVVRDAALAAALTGAAK